MSLKIAVLGPGGVGGLVAAALARSGVDVVVVARAATAQALGETGLSVRSAMLGDFTAHPRAVPLLTDRVDALLVATKATALMASLQRVAAPPGLVVPLLNGVEHVAVLRRRFGEPCVAAGVIRVESDRPRIGEIVQPSPGCRIDLASGRPALAPALAALAQTLQTAGITARIGDSEADVMWSKLARLCALALTTSAADRPLGFVRSDPRWRSALDNAVTETVRVAVAEGARLHAAQTLTELESAHADLGSSMQRDIAAGREPELDAIAGAVLRAGARHAIRCPTVGWLTERVAARAGIPAPAASPTVMRPRHPPDLAHHDAQT
ncbi:MAG: ketopantoate reductase family protein [Solirubrobacteraceae bacterium]